MGLDNCADLLNTRAECMSCVNKSQAQLPEASMSSTTVPAASIWQAIAVAQLAGRLEYQLYIYGINRIYTVHLHDVPCDCNRSDAPGSLRQRKCGYCLFLALLLALTMSDNVPQHVSQHTLACSSHGICIANFMSRIVRAQAACCTPLQQTCPKLFEHQLMHEAYQPDDL